MVGFPFDNLINELYLPQFSKEGEKSLPVLISSRVARMDFMAAYRDLLPIEKMLEQEKIELKKYVHELFPNKTVEEKLEAAKIIYTIGTLL